MRLTLAAPVWGLHPGRDQRRRRTLALSVPVLILAGSVLAHSFGQAAPWWTQPAAIARGAHDVATGSCISCHPLAGVSEAGAAIDLSHEGRRHPVTWLLHELAHPTSPRPPIPPDQIHDIAAYLTSLR